MATEATMAAQGELMSWTEIKVRYPDEWVVLVDSDWSNMTTEHGVVYAHNKDRAALRETTRSLRECAILWTGKRVQPRGSFPTNVVK